MSYYTMHLTEDQGRRHTYQSEDGRVIVDVAAVEHDEGRRTDAANVWRRRGHVDRFMPTTLHVSTYHYDEGGSCFGHFNPYVLSVPGRYEINFARLYEDTPENVRALVAEAAAMYRDGVKAYEASDWIPCEVTPECLAD